MTLNTKSRPASLYSIQYLRAIAAFMVVYHHANVQVSRLTDGVQSLPMAWFGSFGVDLFFVISGYLMWSTTADRSVTTFAFLLRRIRRIVPAYWVITIAVAALAAFKPSLFSSTRFDVAHLLASLAFVPYPSPLFPDHLWPVIVPGWTLNYEMFFYLLFSLCLVLPQTLRLVVICNILIYLTIIGYLSHSDAPLLQFYTNPIMLGFASGILVAHLCSFVTLPKVLAWASIVAGFVIAPLSDWEHGAWWITGATLVILGSVSLEARGGVARTGAKFLGDASYSIYLTHIVVLPALAKVFQLAGAGAWPPVLLLTVYAVAALAASGIVGGLFYVGVEAKLDKALRDRSPATGRTPVQAV